MLAKVGVFALEETTVPEKLPLHSNARLVHLTMKLVQLKHPTAFHAHQEITVRAMVTHSQMDPVMKDGTVKEVLMQRDPFLM